MIILLSGGCSLARPFGGYPSEWCDVTTLPQAHELIWLFEAEPTLLDPGVPWVYNQLTFETTRGADQITCVIAPAYGNASIFWTRDRTEIVALDLQGIGTLAVEREGAIETLTASFLAPELRALRLQLRPTVHLSWGNSADRGSAPERGAEADAAPS